MGSEMCIRDRYINLDDLDVMSLADIQHLSEMEDGGLEFELPDLEKCEINLSRINSDVVSIWADLLKNSDENFEFESKENEYSNKEEMYVVIKDTEQLKLLKEYGLDDVEYSGWFLHELENDSDSEKIIWANNKNQKSGTRFGIKIDGDKMFRIAMNRGMTFVYLDSREHTLEQFLGDTESEIEQEYETDQDYEDSGRDYDE